MTLCPLPVLAPRLPGQQGSNSGSEKPGTKEHTEDEWEAVRGVVQKLYIQDGRKLYETMSIIKHRHGFWATYDSSPSFFLLIILSICFSPSLRSTWLIYLAASHHSEQMYKKRLKKWNFRKRMYRKASRARSQSTTGSDEVSRCGREVEMTISPKKSYSPPISTTSTTPRMFTSASTTPSAMTDTTVAPSTSTILTISQQPSANLGPFAELEVILGSVFTWSICKLEAPSVKTDPMSRYLASPNRPPMQDSRTMYRTFELVFDLFRRGRGKLAGMAARQGFHVLEYVLTEDHPDLVWHMLDTVYDMAGTGHLQLLAMFLDHASAMSRRLLPAQHPLQFILRQIRRCDYRTHQGRRYVCHILRQAWLRNVDMLGQEVGSLAHRHLWLYEQLIWDARTRLRRGSGLEKRAGHMAAALRNLENHHADQDDGSADDAGDGYEKLRIQALVLEFTQMDLGDKVAAEELAHNLLRSSSDGDGSSTSSDQQRSAARFHAYARKMLARLNEEKCQWDDAEDNLRRAVLKREAAHGTNNDLRVVRDMWVLAGHFERLGRHEDAARVEEDAIQRATLYLNDAFLQHGGE
ncbi:hypothetical protein GMORB2_7418 [Geosmithia morbida]|uniref:Clr5 domain-containing protein n=1 Tax=Geosmithia morbida TaxID=1094350 RepID=A0A9P4YVE3_9HYPO|nr:uncharacterized protein GMORB2_7418 [Geosmithia morbida]KAF4122426.1 hypothetical protein GMORB2_7418 [Geosmithia morbida]